MITDLHLSLTLQKKEKQSFLNSIHQKIIMSFKLHEIKCCVKTTNVTRSRDFVICVDHLTFF